MNLSEAREVLGSVIHSPVRLTLVAALDAADSADFQTLRDELGVSDSLLSKHAGILEDAGLLRITKEFVGRTPATSMRLTRVGREEYVRYLDALDRIVLGLT